MSSAIYVAYTDSTHAAICTWFDSPQLDLPGGAPPDYGQTTTADPLWAVFYEALPDAIKSGLPAPV